MRTRPADSVTDGADRPEKVLEWEIERTEQAIQDFRVQQRDLVRDVYDEVEKLSKTAATLPPDWRRTESRLDPRLEERFDELVEGLPGRVAQLVVLELAGPRVRAALNQAVDARLRTVIEHMARLTNNPPPAQRIRSMGSRRRR